MSTPAAPPDLGTNTADRKIIVGIDYGTTFTGASYVSSRGTTLNDITVINTWPGNARSIDTVVKTPSRIAYASENDKAARDLWGYQVAPGMKAYSWTKLLLDKNMPLTEYDDVALEKDLQAGILNLPAGKTAVDVAADYLNHIYQHIKYTLARHITQVDLDITPLEYWFTVPAIWSDQAKDATQSAARRAGFWSSVARPHDRLYFITEPEAAAVTALKKYTSESIGGSVKVGDGVLICDCGGGTVDITTYVVNKVAPVLKFEELLTGIGGKCGSTAIDRNFYKLMLHRFGSAFQDLPASAKGPGSNFMNRFEIIKRDFGTSCDFDVFELPLNMIPPSGVSSKDFDADERLVKITSDDLRTVFDPVVDQIIKLVQRQINDARKLGDQGKINRIILVGGFGDSEYLRQRVLRTFETSSNITITIPTNPQAAIVQGAALRGLEGIRSTTKRCRRHYGFDWSHEFREGYDDDRNAYTDPFNGTKRIGGIVRWMIAKGEKHAEDYKQTTCVAQPHRYCNSLKKRNALWASDRTDAPERMDDDGVYKVGSIIVDFAQVDLALFPVKTREGRKVYRLEYNIRVTFGAQDGLLKFEATCQGKTIGRTSIDYGT
ncbi:Hsp70 family protein [Aspergillus homomorphus CBS 101889]|uniref:Actin-like ATPase domain-containing protein n=1 Tax=Aspergillus homomorphus (strain CBS 101889) TaxID=1450537 RepID=A0A395I173_ASPHC|nr:actin-like ATPase domain-containing protein [Aspergillus homomorphus CBS 101889]RAL13363.1 actin-like ATPase domain-containing protein [Aspergillus homomorphus CBS 101889]